MKAEDIIDALKDVSPSHEVTNIIIDGNTVYIKSQRELPNNQPKIQKTKLCPTLANMTVEKLQEQIHATAGSNAERIAEAIVIEKILNQTNKAIKMYEEIHKEGD